jgi:hypothetical protein
MIVWSQNDSIPLAIWQTCLTSGDTILAWKTVGAAASRRQPRAFPVGPAARTWA